MLNRLGWIIGAVVSLLLITPAAHAEQICYKTDPATGLCVIWVGDSGGGGGGGGAGGGGVGGGGVGGGDGGGGGDSSTDQISINGRMCTYTGPITPQPPKSDAVWEEHTDGTIYGCEYITGVLGAPVTIQFWAADPPQALPPPDPAVLAQQALASMNLNAINIGIVPESAPGRIGVIGLPSWMWVAGPSSTTIGPITRSASTRGYTVTATAKVAKIVWNMGDGQTVTCHGSGTPYADSYGKQSSPTCGHTYTRQGRYTVSATSYWTVTWAGIGQTGSIPIDFTSSTDITMGESQAITQ